MRYGRKAGLADRATAEAADPDGDAMILIVEGEGTSFGPLLAAAGLDLTLAAGGSCRCDWLEGGYDDA